LSRCIIHIGTRKTGTSSIQQSLNGYSDDDFVYADINGHPNHGAALYSVFAKHPEKLAFHKKNNRSQAELDKYVRNIKIKLSDAIAKAKGRTILFSGETLSHKLTRQELEAMCCFFQEHFSKVEIVAYIRSPRGYITSEFQQCVKDAKNVLNPELDYYYYKKHLQVYDDIFGKENVKLWKFDPKNFISKCVVQDFCHRLNINLPSGRIVRVNDSISFEVLSLLFAYRKYGGEFGSTLMKGPENQRLIEALDHIGDTKFSFSPDLIQPVVDKNKADIAWIEGRMGVSFAEDLSEYKEQDVRGEMDLLNHDQAVVDKLLEKLGSFAPKGVQGKTPQEVAVLVHALREKTDHRKAANMPRKRAEARGGKKKNSCILHIGMHKTGSSSIQASLAGYEDDSFVYYRGCKGYKNHSLDIFHLIGNGRADRSGYDDWAESRDKKRPPNEEVKQHLQETFQSLNGRTLVFSGEGITVLSLSELEDLVNMLKLWADDIQVVAYVRPPEGYLTSLTQQGLKAGNVNRIKHVDRHKFDYEQVFSKFDDAFGAGNVHLWKFSPTSFPSHCVVRDFCDRLEINFPDSKIVRTNESLSKQVLSLLYIYYKYRNKYGFAKLSNKEALKIGEGLESPNDDKFRFSPDVVESIFENNKDDISWMEKRLGESLLESISEHKPSDVRDESDLLNPEPEVIARLRLLLGSACPEGMDGHTKNEIAHMVNALREEVRNNRVLNTGEKPSHKRAENRRGQGDKRGSAKARSVSKRIDVVEEKKKSRCILHIGMHKTGSSSIQASLGGFEDDSFVYYKNMGKETNHGGDIFKLLGTDGLDRTERDDWVRSRSGKTSPGDELTRQHLKQQLCALNGRTLLVSAEGMTFLSREELQELANFLRNWVDEIQIVAYVRPLAGYITSLGQQFLKNGRETGLNLEQLACDYEGIYSKFDDVFGRENVHLWKFFPESFPSHCVVQDFCRRLKISLPKDRIVRVNDSLSKQAVSLLYTYYKYAVGDRVTLSRSELMLIREGLEALEDDKFRFSPDVVKSVLKKREKDIFWMEKRLGESLFEELGECKPSDIRDESDLLLNDNSKVVTRLGSYLGSACPENMSGETSDKIILLVNALREKHETSRAHERYEKRFFEGDIQSISLSELINNVRQRYPDEFTLASEQTAVTLVSEIFTQMNENITQTDESIINYRLFGRFKFRGMKNRLSDTVLSREIIFNPAKLTRSEGR